MCLTIDFSVAKGVYYCFVQKCFSGVQGILSTLCKLLYLSLGIKYFLVFSKDPSVSWVFFLDTIQCFLKNCMLPECRKIQKKEHKIVTHSSHSQNVDAIFSFILYIWQVVFQIQVLYYRFGSPKPTRKVPSFNVWSQNPLN